MEEKKEVQAIAKMQRISPIKARLVADTIRGKKVSDALAILENTNMNYSYFLKGRIMQSIISVILIMIF